MNTAWNEFKYSIAEVKKIRTIYDHMIANVRLSQEDVSDLLRAQLVNAVSALDRFLHELVRIGIVESFLQQRRLYRYCPWMRGMATSQISCNNGIDKKASHVPL